jgi:hypothetical protein
MTGDRAIRASDEDRERAAAALSGHYAAGRLTGAQHVTGVAAPAPMVQPVPSWMALISRSSTAMTR